MVSYTGRVGVEHRNYEGRFKNPCSKSDVLKGEVSWGF